MVLFSASKRRHRQAVCQLTSWLTAVAENKTIATHRKSLDWWEKIRRRNQRGWSRSEAIDQTA
jgi:hypothetical protein